MRILLSFLLIWPLTVVAEELRPTIAVSGEGRFEAVPDMATVSVGVTSQAKTAADALGQTNAAMSRVLTRLGEAGIAPRDMQTEGLNLSPVWDNRNLSNGRRDIVAFMASNGLRVRVRDLDKLGGILDLIVADGANQFHGLFFGLQEPGPAEDEARRRAVAEAARKAQLYANAAGVGLGPVLSISEARAGPAPMMALERMAASDGVPVAAGELTISASVNMVFGIAE